MSPTPHDLLQAAAAGRARLVRITAHDADNRYTAKQLELDANEDLTESDDTMEVYNLAEADTAGGQLQADLDAIAIDLEGRWFISVSAPKTAVAARVVSHRYDAEYTLQPQCVTPAGTFSDDTEADEIIAINLAERNLGDGGALDDDEIVLAEALDASTSSTSETCWAFDHPVYAKYRVDT
ncbi:MAG: hypothetical protein HN909_02700 [Phycisphaerales bacterium]|jgi:hypothetical protein|nr:hypothetical protein [Phycisphaerales bacterium]MBT7170661.1 hypothetical protein [Phycisphaerales bacterium]